MTALVRAEWRKLRTVRSSWAVLTVGLVAELVLRTVSASLVPRAAPESEVVFALRPSIGFAAAVVLLPVLLASTEWRWRTAVSTYTIEPRRQRVHAAKLLLGAAAGLVVAALLTVTSVIVQFLLLQGKEVALPSPDQWAAAVAGPTGAGLALGVIGVSLGTLIREQAVAVSVAVGALFVAPLPLILIGPEWYAWSPSGWIDALAGQRLVIDGLLHPAGALTILAVTAAVLAAAGAFQLRRSDLA